jgi:hypothetical protein
MPDGHSLAVKCLEIGLLALHTDTLLGTFVGWRETKSAPSFMLQPLNSQADLAI